MGQYSHLSLEEREEIMLMRHVGASIGLIAGKIGRSKSTVSRELARNPCRRGSLGEFYRASAAQRRYGERKLPCVRVRRLVDPGLAAPVTALICEGRWSPEQGAVLTYKTVLKMMREMGIRCGIRREAARHRYSSYRGVVGSTFENVVGRDFDAAAPWEKLGADVTESKVAGRKTHWADARPLHQGDCGLGRLDVAGHGPAGADARHAVAEDSSGRLPGHALGHGVAVPVRRPRAEAEGSRRHPEHVAQGQPHRQRRHRAALWARQGRVLPREGAGDVRGLQTGDRVGNVDVSPISAAVR